MYFHTPQVLMMDENRFINRRYLKKSKESRETELFHDGAKKPEHTSEEITGVFTMVNKYVIETCDKFEDV